MKQMKHPVPVELFVASAVVAAFLAFAVHAVVGIVV
jgi:hypothetical protein